MAINYRAFFNWRVGTFFFIVMVLFWGRLGLICLRISEKRSFIEQGLVVLENCRHVQIGMSREEALSYLGKPQRELQTPSARGTISSLFFASAESKEKFPQVDVNARGKVVAVACSEKLQRVASAADWAKFPAAATGPIATAPQRP